jgi:hypothetical protein
MIEVERIDDFLIGSISYYIKGTKILHREDGPAIEFEDGLKEWLVNGKLHRVDGPAIVSSDGRKEWYINGILHREDGPAVMDYDGKVRWYLNGVRLSKEAWFELLPEDKKIKALFCEFFMR